MTPTPDPLYDVPLSQRIDAQPVDALDGDPLRETLDIAAAIPLMQQAQVEGLLATLRLGADMAWINHFGEHVWLKAHVVDGRRIGITDCCDFDTPCERHAALEGDPA